jgi:dATP pyrophosphohydrolase
VSRVGPFRRAPFQVLVFPYRLSADRTLEVAVFQRANGGHWQGIAGGGDEGETPERAARREAFEEAGIATPEGWLALRPVLSVPVSVIRPAERKHWPRWLSVIPCYPFAVAAGTEPVRLSPEHTHFRWTSIDEARAVVRWDNDRIALTALAEALRPLPAGPP